MFIGLVYGFIDKNLQSIGRQKPVAHPENAASQTALRLRNEGAPRHSPANGVKTSENSGKSRTGDIK